MTTLGGHNEKGRSVVVSDGGPGAQAPSETTTTAKKKRRTRSGPRVDHHPEAAAGGGGEYVKRATSGLGRDFSPGAGRHGSVVGTGTGLGTGTGDGDGRDRTPVSPISSLCAPPPRICITVCASTCSCAAAYYLCCFPLSRSRTYCVMWSDAGCPCGVSYPIRGTTPCRPPRSRGMTRPRGPPPLHRCVCYIRAPGGDSRRGPGATQPPAPLFARGVLSGVPIGSPPSEPPSLEL